MKKVTYKLDNIDCAACSLKIENTLGSLDSVISVSLNFMTMKLFVTYDEYLINEEKIENYIHKSLTGVKIIQKNNKHYEDTYKEEGVFKKILFKKKGK